MVKRQRKGPSISDKLEAARANRYKVIHERNLLILALGKHAGFDLHLVNVDDAKLSEPDAWDKVVCLHTPAGQLHWKLSPADQDDFRSLKTLRKTDYDGAKAADKAERLERLHTLARSKDTA